MAHLLATRHPSQTSFAPYHGLRRVVVALLLGLVTCSGCWWSSEPEKEKEKEKKVEKPVDPIESQAVVNRPPIEHDGLQSENQPLSFKPRHQMPVSVQVRANRDDFRGTLNWQLLDAGGRPLPPTSVLQSLTQSRPAVLPKKQWRQFDFSFLAPPLSQVRLALDLRSSAIGSGADLKRPNTQALPAQMYQLLVLAGDPLDYRRLAEENMVQFPNDTIDNSSTSISSPAHYAVVFPTKENSALPRGLLHWTTFAFIVWDDYDPTKLDAEEQAALVDWLHWGGHLIISGPDTLNTLADSFLKPYLPARPGESITLDSDQLAFLNRPSEWQSAQKPLQVIKPWSGVELLAHREASQLLDSPHLVERRVGRGRVVVSAFRLDQRELREWPGYDGFWHTCLLRRPARRFGTSRDGDLQLVYWKSNAHVHDSAPTTDLRLFARDSGRQLQPLPSPPESIDPFAPPRGRNSPYLEEAPIYDSMGAWADNGPVQNAAREILSDAAGIVVPERTFVTRLLGIYLIVLVPVNWLLFRLINRVEWAWFAVPVLALLFAGVVTWLAQVNVGFARSRTEVAVVELQPNHARAHVARYMALYSSLGTAYEVVTSGVDSLALPMANTGGDVRPTHDLRTEATTIAAGEQTIPAARMTGFEVSSNATGMLQVEQVAAFGSIECLEGDADGVYEVTNTTGHTLTGFLQGPRGVAWIGSLEHNQSKTVIFSAPDDEFDISKPAFQPRVNSVNLRPLVDVAMKERVGNQLQLIAWCDADVPGTTITPAAAQHRVATLVVAHLDYGEFPALAFDVNYRPRKTKEVDSRLDNKP